MAQTEEAQWRTWGLIDLEALRHNLEVARAHTAGAGIIAVVKADAYGHGLERVARALDGEVDYLGVAAIAEARRIAEVQRNRVGGNTEATQRTAVLLLGPLLPEEMVVAVSHGWHFTLSSLNDLRDAAGAARKVGDRALVHLAVDTGMGRMGALEKDYLAIAREAMGYEELRVSGLATHLPSADEDMEFTREQLSHFEDIVDTVRREWPAENGDLPQVHVLNSAGVMRFGDRGSGCLIRPGLMLYGVAPEAEFQERLKPVLTLKTRVRLVRRLPAGRSISYGRSYITDRETYVATLGIGYGDGYPRSLSGHGAEVLIRGQRCPLLGRVTMDQIMVDVSVLEASSGPVRPGEEVVVYGRQGSDEISVAEVAAKAGTISWEILTSVTQRVEQVAVGEERLDSLPKC